MKNIKIMHLFPKRMSLYGEYGNVSIVKKVLTDAGYSVTVEEYENGNLNLEGIDFVYIGSGTEDALMIANSILTKSADAVKSSIGSGKVWLATGNAPALFGGSINRNGKDTAAVGAFPYACTIDDKGRFLGDVLTEDSNIFSASLIGFVNTSCTYEGMDKPLVSFKLNTNLGNDKKSPADGYISENFFAVEMIGPFLVKNPPALQELCRRITGDKNFTLPENSNAWKAYKSALNELGTRL